MEKTREFDLHGHTTSVKWWRRFDAVEMTPAEVVRLAAEAGLDGVAITDHDSFAGLDLALEAGAKHGVVVVPGVELTTHEKLTFPHVLILGLDPERLKNKRPPVFKSVEEAARWARNLGAVVVAPHPGVLRFKGAPASLTYEMLDQKISWFDAVQTHDIEIGFNAGAEKIALKHHKPRIGGSDFHLSEQVGIVRTRVFGEVGSWQEAITAIRQGRVEPFFHQNRTAKELKEFSRAALFRKRMKQFFV